MLLLSAIGGGWGGWRVWGVVHGLPEAVRVGEKGRGRTEEAGSTRSSMGGVFPSMVLVMKLDR